MFKLLRFYSVASFVVIFVAATVLTLFYRQVTIRWIDDLAIKGNLTLAQTVLNAIKPELITYLGVMSDGDASDRGLTREKLPTGVTADLLRMTNGTSVGSIKIYRRDGRIFFSTESEQIGNTAENHTAFQSALDGRLSSFMTYRDTFNSLEGTTTDDNLMHTYIPIRNTATEPVLGVLEIHTDMNQQVEGNSKALLITLLGAHVILALLYAALVMVVRYAKNIIESQQETIRERTAALEVLSKRLLGSEEQKKQKIAIDLHEGLAQTLSAIKFNVESSRGNRRGANAQPLEHIVPVLQSAIQEVRSIATELRPSSLDELGLLPTINWYCREFEKQHQEICIEREISLQEATIPVPLKIVIYRIIESTFKNIAHYSSADQIRLAMQGAGNNIHLRISHTPVEKSSAAAVTAYDTGSDPQFRFVETMERVTLSGGTFRASRTHDGWVMLHASWAC